MAINPFRTPVSFRRRPESRRERPGGEEMAGFTGYPPSVVTPVVIPAKREWITKPLDSGLRRNEGGGDSSFRLPAAGRPE